MKQKLACIALLIITVILVFNSNVYATNKMTMSNIIKDGDSFLTYGNDVNTTINTAALKETSNTIYQILYTIAIVLAIVIGMVIGIQFMVASVEEKAKIKETLVPYVIGVFVVFAAFSIWKMVIEIGNSVTPTQQVQNTNINSTPVGPVQTHCTTCGRKLLADGTCPNCPSTLD